MESIAMVDHEDQPTNSSEEVDQQDQDLGSGTRSYECVYCRRGFTTAQALGGHMNIHRKDRAKSRPSNSSSSKQDEYSCYANPRFYKPVFASSPPSYLSVASHQEGQIHYRTYFPSTSSAQPINYENNHQDPNQAITSPSMEEISSSLLLGRSHGEDRDSKRSIQSRNEEDELDLELRLGHDP